MIEQSFKIRFSEFETAVPLAPGLYEIVTDEGKLLKVSISGNLRLRLIQHRQSKQSRLKLKDAGDWSNPSDVMCKQSILAKHLFFHSPVQFAGVKRTDSSAIFGVSPHERNQESRA